MLIPSKISPKIPMARGMKPVIAGKLSKFKIGNKTMLVASANPALIKTGMLLLLRPATFYGLAVITLILTILTNFAGVLLTFSLPAALILHARLRLVMPGDWVVVDDDGAVVIPAALLDHVLEAGPEQERMEGWIMDEVGRGVELPGLYPMNDATRARYEAWKAGRC